MFLSYPGCRHKPSRATPLDLRGFQRGPQAPLAVPRASELAAAFSLPFWPVKKEDIRRAKEANLIELGRVLPLSQKRYNRANVHGGVKTPPYRATETGNFPVNPARGIPLPGGMYASPTNTRYRVYDTGNGCWREVYGPHACGPYRPAGNGRRMNKANACRKKARFIRRRFLPGRGPGATTRRRSSRR